MVRRAPPLWTWPAALLLAAAVLLGAWAWSAAVYPRIMADGLELGRIASTSAPPADVVLIGASKTRCAVTFDVRMGQLLAGQGAPARVVRITRARGRFSDFDPALDVLERRPPKLVLVEAEFYALEPDFLRPRGVNRTIDWRDRIRATLRYAMGSERGLMGTMRPYNTGADAVRACRPVIQVRPEDYRAILLERRVSSPAERRAVVARLRRLQARGVAVALLQLPRSPSATAQFPAQLASDAAALLARAPAADGLAVIGPAPAIGEDGFVDQGHLNGRGQAIYSAWLAGQLAARLREPSGG